MADFNTGLDMSGPSKSKSLQGLSALEKRALKGERGAATAKRAFKRLMASDYDADTKKQIKAFYRGKGDAPKDGSLLSKLTDNPIVDAVGTGLMLIDKPKRAVVAALEELNEAAGQLDENDSSFLDNFARKPQYGFGDVVEQAVKTGKRRGGLGKVLADKLDSSLAKRALGLVGDVAFDPTTYVTFGATTAGAKAARGGTKAVEAIEGATKVARGGTKLRRAGIARRLGKIGEDEAAKAVRQRGASAVPQSILDKVGVTGGVRLAGKTVVPHDVLRKLSAPLGAVKAAVGDSKTVRGLQRGLGDDALKEFRLLSRDRTASAGDVVKALGHIDAKRARRLAKARFEGRIGDELDSLLTEAKRKGVDGEVIHGAVSGDIGSAAVLSERMGVDAADRFRAALARTRTEANGLAAADFIADAGPDYMPRFLTPEAAEAVAKRSPSGRGGAKSFEKRAHTAGDEFGDQILGSPELHAEFSAGMIPDSRAAVEAQMEGLIRSWNPQLDQVFSRDAYKNLPRYLKSVAERVGQMVEAKELGLRGVADVIPETAVDDVAATKMGALKFGQASKAATGARQAATADSTGLAAVRSAIEDASAAAADITRVADEDAARALGTARSAPEKSLAPLRDVHETGTPSAVQARRELNGLRPRFDSAADATEYAKADPGELLASAEDQLDTVRQEMAGAGNPTRRAALEEVEGIRARQVETIGRLGSEPDTQARSVLALLAQADELEAQAASSLAKAVDMEEFVRQMAKPQMQRSFQRTLTDGMAQMTEYGMPDRQLSKFHLEALERVAHVAKDPNVFLKYIDKANRFFKTYAILTPGFHVRNSMGATFMNFVAGVSPSSYRQVGLHLGKFSKGGIDAVRPGRFRDFLVELERTGGIFWDDAQIASEVGRHAGQSQRLLIDKLGSNKLTRNIGVTENLFTNASRNIGSRVERFQRTVLAWDVYKKGGTLDEALDKVAQMHFDYSDLSTQETAYLKRIIPFWTWTSRNLPLQLEMVLTEPRMYQRFNAIQDNAGVQDDTELVPSWMKDSATAIPLGGGQFISPDLPFQDVDDQTGGLVRGGPTSLLQSASPYVKVPIELLFGQQAFNNIPLTEKRTGMPESWSIIPGMVPALRATNVLNGDRDPKTGRYLLSNRNAYVIEQAIPVLARFRRLTPSEPKYQERRLTSVLSFMGINSRTATYADKTSETYRISDKLSAMVDRGVESGKVKASRGR